MLSSRKIWLASLFVFLASCDFFNSAQVKQGTSDFEIEALPRVSVLVTNGRAREGDSQKLSFEISRKGSLLKPLKISLQIVGTARNGIDYEMNPAELPYAGFPYQKTIPSELTFPAKTSKMKISLVPTDDSDVEAAEDLVVSVVLRKPKTYTLGANAKAELMIEDNDTVSNPERLPILTANYPIDPDVCLLSLADKNLLQQYLDGTSPINGCTSHKVRLEAADYRGTLSEITIRSGYQLYGLPGTTVPNVVIEPGTTGAIVSGVRGLIDFPPSNQSTRFNIFRRIDWGGIRIRNAVVENNLFLGFYMAPDRSILDVDTASSGFIRNNRFLFFLSQQPSYHIKIIGDVQKQSYGNTMLGFTSNTAGGDSVLIRDQGDFNMIAGGGEAWNWANQGSTGLYDLERTPGDYPKSVYRFLATFAGQGSAQKNAFFDVGSDEFIAFNASVNPIGNPSFIQRSTNMKSMVTDYNIANTWVDQAVGAFRLKGVNTALPQENASISVNGTIVSGELPAANQSIIKAMMVDPARPGSPWERPNHLPVPNHPGPAGSPIVKCRATPQSPETNDSWPCIQNALDALPDNGIVELHAGTYYVSQAIRMTRGKGLRGAGPEKTAIVAQSPAIDLIVFTNGLSYSTPRQCKTQPNSSDQYWGFTVPFTLMDLTLQDGRNGLHFNETQAGGSAAFHNIVLSDVVIRNMTQNGILLDHIYAWDTNTIDRLYLVNNDVGFKHIGRDNTDYPYCYEWPGFTYMDKNNFYESQFIGNRIAWQGSPGRESGGNLFVNSLFKDNREAAFKVSAYTNPLFINTDFKNNGGNSTQPTVSNTGSLIFVNAKFTADQNGQVFIRGLPTIEGSIFERGTSTADVKALDLQIDHRAHVTNSIFNDVKVGSLRRGTFINNRFAPGDSFSNYFHFVKSDYFGNNTVNQVLMSGPSNPRPLFLWGTAFGN